MTKYIQSYWDYVLDVNGVILPKANYSPAEMQVGLKNIVEVNEDQLKTLMENRGFKSMLDKKLYRVLDNLPERYKDTSDRIKEALSKKEMELSDKDKEIADLKAKISELNKVKVSEKPVIKKDK